MNSDTKRQLNSILFADIVGYTALMQKDESSASTLLRRFHSEMENSIAQYNGKIVNFYGDGALCIFLNPLEAVRYAIHIQTEFQKNPQVPVRVGIHNGTVVYERNKVFGDSVNLASRIESLGNPGSILFSKKVRDDVKNHSDLSIYSLGSFELKNVQEPMHIYALANSPFSVPKRNEILEKLSPSSPQHWKWLTAFSLVCLLLIITKFIIFPNENSSTFENQYLNRAQIALTNFENNTTVANYDIIGKMAADWITHGIVENQVAPVISAEAIETYSNITKASLVPSNIFKSFSGDIQVIKGAYFLSDTNLIFQCSIFDSELSRPLFAFKKVECHVEKPLEGIEKLKDQILGYWVTQKEKHLSATPPTYSAYKLYLQAKNVWVENYDIADSLLRESIKADPAFYHSKVLLAHIFYNKQEYNSLDSLVSLMESEIDRDNLVQINSVKYLRSLLEGNNREIYKTYLNEYSTAPNELFKNTAMMVIASDFVKNPKLVAKIYHQVNNDILNYEKCDYCIVRVGAMARALMALNETEKAIHLMEPLIDKSRSYHLWNNLVIAYVKTRNFEKLDALLKKAEIGLQYDSPNYLYFLSAYHAQLLEINNEKEKYAKLAIEKYLSISPINQKMLGRSFYILENYDESKKHFESYLESNPSDIFCLSKLASIAFINGKPEIAMNYIDEISIAKNKYDFGYGSYFIGQAYAQGGKYIDAIEHLKEAILRGDRFSIIDYENDPLLAELHKMPEWSEFLDEWKFEN